VGRLQDLQAQDQNQGPPPGRRKGVAPPEPDVGGVLERRQHLANASLTIAASASTNAGRALKDSVRLMRIPLSRPKAWASTSRSYRISRWSATKPIGQTSTSLAADRAMASSRSGPSHGSPVWLADWKANSQGGRSMPAATSRQLSSSCW